MVVKVKEKSEMTRHVKNNDKSKKYILRGERNVRYHDRILSNKKEPSIYDVARYLSDDFVSLIFTGFSGNDFVDNSIFIFPIKISSIRNILSRSKKIYTISI